MLQQSKMDEPFVDGTRERKKKHNNNGKQGHVTLDSNVHTDLQNVLSTNELTSRDITSKEPHPRGEIRQKFTPGCV